MSKLLNKLKMKKSLKAQIESEQSSGSKKDTRFLNYYDLKPNEKMTVLLMPFAEGEMWHKYKVHGPNLKHQGKYVKGIGSVNCAYASSGEDCPACQMGFNLLELERDTGDKSYKDEAKKWFGKQYTVMQCVVLESPVEILESPDKNEVKLFAVPYGIEKMITNSIQEGIIPEDEMFMTPLVIKKEGGDKGTFASYNNSFFARHVVDEETLEAFDDLIVEPYVLEELIGDAFPKASTTQEVQEWFDKAEELYMKATGQAGDEEEEEEEQAPPTKKTSPLRDRMKKSAEKEEQPEQPDYDEDVPMNLNKEEDQEQEEEKKPTSSVRERLARLRR
jgi:hypothetical protein